MSMDATQTQSQQTQKGIQRKEIPTQSHFNMAIMQGKSPQSLPIEKITPPIANAPNNPFMKAVLQPKSPFGDQTKSPSNPVEPQKNQINQKSSNPFLSGAVKNQLFGNSQSSMVNNLFSTPNAPSNNPPQRPSLFSVSGGNLNKGKETNRGPFNSNNQMTGDIFKTKADTSDGYLSNNKITSGLFEAGKNTGLFGSGKDTGLFGNSQSSKEAKPPGGYFATDNQAPSSKNSLFGKKDEKDIPKPQGKPFNLNSAGGKTNQFANPTNNSFEKSNVLAANNNLFGLSSNSSEHFSFLTKRADQQNPPIQTPQNSLNHRAQNPIKDTTNDAKNADSLKKKSDLKRGTLDTNASEQSKQQDHVELQQHTVIDEDQRQNESSSKEQSKNNLSNIQHSKQQQYAINQNMGAQLQSNRDKTGLIHPELLQIQKQIKHLLIQKKSVTLVAVHQQAAKNQLSQLQNYLIQTSSQNQKLIQEYKDYQKKIKLKEERIKQFQKPQNQEIISRNLEVANNLIVEKRTGEYPQAKQVCSQIQRLIGVIIEHYDDDENKTQGDIKDKFQRISQKQQLNSEEYMFLLIHENKTIQASKQQLIKQQESLMTTNASKLKLIYQQKADDSMKSFRKASRTNNQSHEKSFTKVEDDQRIKEKRKILRKIKDQNRKLDQEYLKLQKGLKQRAEHNFKPVQGQSSIMFRSTIIEN